MFLLSLKPHIDYVRYAPSMKTGAVRWKQRNLYGRGIRLIPAANGDSTSPSRLGVGGSSVCRIYRAHLSSEPTGACAYLQ